MRLGFHEEYITAFGTDVNFKEKCSLFLRTFFPILYLSFLWPTQLFNFMLDLSVFLFSTSLESLSRSFLLA